MTVTHIIDRLYLNVSYVAGSRLIETPMHKGPNIGHKGPAYVNKGPKTTDRGAQT